MKKSIYLLLTVFLAFSVISCDDNEEKLPSLSGKWKYTQPYFEFDYASDSLVIEMYQGQKIVISVEELKEQFSRMATDKMKDYFKGIEIFSGEQLRILAQLQSSDTLSIHATYQQSHEFVQVTLDPEDMELLLGDKAGMIPPVSFRYSLQQEKLNMYFDEAYIRTIYSMMENQLVPMIVSMMGIDFSRLPEGTEQIVIDGVKDQLSLILDKIIRLRIGFVLQKE